jgi:hypothetical protein
MDVDSQRDLFCKLGLQSPFSRIHDTPFMVTDLEKLGSPQHEGLLMASIT